MQVSRGVYRRWKSREVYRLSPDRAESYCHGYLFQGCHQARRSLTRWRPYRFSAEARSACVRPFLYRSRATRPCASWRVVRPDPSARMNSDAGGATRMVQPATPRPIRIARTTGISPTFLAQSGGTCGACGREIRQHRIPDLRYCLRRRPWQEWHLDHRLACLLGRSFSADLCDKINDFRAGHLRDKPGTNASDRMRRRKSGICSLYSILNLGSRHSHSGSDRLGADRPVNFINLYIRGNNARKSQLSAPVNGPGKHCCHDPLPLTIQ